MRAAGRDTMRPERPGSAEDTPSQRVNGRRSSLPLPGDVADNPMLNHEWASLPPLSASHALSQSLDPLVSPLTTLELLRLQQQPLLPPSQQSLNRSALPLNLTGGADLPTLPTSSLLQLATMPTMPLDAALPISNPFLSRTANDIILPPLLSTTTPPLVPPAADDHAAVARLLLENQLVRGQQQRAAAAAEEESALASLVRLNALRRQLRNPRSAPTSAEALVPPPSLDSAAAQSAVFQAPNMSLGAGASGGSITSHDALAAAIVANPTALHDVTHAHGDHPLLHQANNLGGLLLSQSIRPLEEDHGSTAHHDESNRRIMHKALAASGVARRRSRSSAAPPVGGGGDAADAASGSSSIADSPARKPSAAAGAGPASLSASLSAAAAATTAQTTSATTRPLQKQARAKKATGTTSRTDAQWESMFKRLVDYKAKNGDCLVPQRYDKDPKLGKWVCYQRKCKNTLSEERKQKLTEVGFVFAARTLEPWESMYSKLVEYKALHGDCLVPQNFPQDKKLGKWVAIQRIYKKSLTEERLKLLNDIGFVWSVNQALWDKMFDALVEFKRIHGHCNVPWNYNHGGDSGGNVHQLANWIQRQRKMKNRLPEDRLARLEEIGLDI